MEKKVRQITKITNWLGKGSGRGRDGELNEPTLSKESLCSDDIDWGESLTSGRFTTGGPCTSQASDRGLQECKWQRAADPVQGCRSSTSNCTHPVLGGSNGCHHCFCSPHINTEFSRIPSPHLCCTPCQQY